RSMMVHPSQEILRHGEYIRWVRAIRDRWVKTLRRDDADPDRQEVAEEMRAAYADLAQTVDHLPSFDELLKVLPRAMDETIITEINSAFGRAPEIDWKSDYAHILVGGQAMDRGFTVEGLTVTYMPRPVGVGNADTIQQRARFFGYKADYLQ